MLTRAGEDGGGQKLMFSELQPGTLPRGPPRPPRASWRHLPAGPPGQASDRMVRCSGRRAPFDSCAPQAWPLWDGAEALPAVSARLTEDRDAQGRAR